MLFFINLLFDQKTRQIAKTLSFHGKIQNQLVATFVDSCPSLSYFYIETTQVLSNINSLLKMFH